MRDVNVSCGPQKAHEHASTSTRAAATARSAPARASVAGLARRTRAGRPRSRPAGGAAPRRRLTHVLPGSREARLAIEGEASGLAAGRRTPADIRALRRALRRREEHRSDIEEHVDADLAFHRSVVAASHNEILLGLFDDFTPRLRQAMVDMLRIRRRFGSDEDQAAHAAVLEAIVTRDADAARSLSRDHLGSLMRSPAAPAPGPDRGRRPGA